MRYSYSVPAGIVRSVIPAAAVSIVLEQLSSSRAEADHRWPAIVRKLAALRKRGRRSIRIVDANCGAGDLLVHAAQRARALGYLAIEGHGIDCDPAMIARARAAARIAADPAIGLEFEVGDARNALSAEAIFPADIVLYAEQARDTALKAVAGAAGISVLGAPGDGHETA